MRGSKDEAGIRRFLVMGCCSVLLHVILAAIITLPGMGSGKTAKVYRVDVRYLQAQTEQIEEAESLAAAPAREEAREEPEAAAVLDLTGITMPVFPETIKRLEEAVENLDVVETPVPPVEIAEIIAAPVPPVENAIITPGGGLGSGEDTEDGGGNSLLASGSGSGWGGSSDGVGWGGGSGSPGSGGGTGGGYGSGTGNSRGSAGLGSGEPGVYFVGMPGITPPVYDRTPQPSYPAESRSRREQGETLLRAEVLSNGRVGRLEIEKSSGYARLDEVALRTVRNWRFKPALKGREAVACWVHIPVRFSLN